MGTNFYAKIKMQPRSKARIESYLEDMKEAVGRGDFIKFSNTLDDLVYDWGEIKGETKIHLGKRSFGWAFLWDLNGMKYYKPSLRSIISFIKENNAVIEDEYGREITLDEFLNDEIGYCLRPGETPLRAEELDESELRESTKDYIKRNFFDKGLPYYRFCTSKTYREMHPNEPGGKLYRDNGEYGKFVGECSEYTDIPIMPGDTDFVTRDCIRCALFTDFS